MNGSTPVTRVLPRATGPVSSRRPRCRALHTCVRAVDQRVPGRFTGLTRSGMGVPGPRGVDGLMRRLIVGGASDAVFAASARRIALRGAIAAAIALAGLVTWVAAGGTSSADAPHGAPLAALGTMPVPRAPRGPGPAAAPPGPPPPAPGPVPRPGAPRRGELHQGQGGRGQARQGAV